MARFYTFAWRAFRGEEPGLGGRFELPDGRRPDVRLFAETPSRFLVEVREKDVHALDPLLVGVASAPVGVVTSEPRLVIRGAGKKVRIDEPLEALKRAWKEPLKW